MLTDNNTTGNSWTTNSLKPVYRSVILGLKSKEEITDIEGTSKRLLEYGLPHLEQYYKSQ